MKAVAWKLCKMNNKFAYVLQVDLVRGIRNENRLLKELSGWKRYGEGYDSKTKSKTIMFRFLFEDEEEWKAWARQFPYELTEVGKSGKEKPYKLGLAYINSPRRRNRDAR